MRVITVIVFIIFYNDLISQSEYNKTVSHHVYYDTIIKPDHFLVNFTVSEKIEYEGWGKKQLKKLISLDSVYSHFVNDLKKMGFNQPIMLKSISEKQKSQYYPYQEYYEGKLLFEGNYFFIIKNKDSAEMLFLKIDKQKLSSLTIVSQLTDESRLKIQEVMSMNCYSKSKAMMSKIILENNIINITSLKNYFNFYLINKENQLYFGAE